MGAIDEQREAERRIEQEADERSAEFALKNPTVIVLRKAWDGNYIGYAKKYGKLITIRDVGPQTIVQDIITKE